MRGLCYTVLRGSKQTTNVLFTIYEKFDMKKIEFKKLIERNRDKFICLTLEDATIRRDYNHTALCIIWNTGIGSRTTLKTMRGKPTDLKCQEELNKYKRWIQ